MSGDGGGNLVLGGNNWWYSKLELAVEEDNGLLQGGGLATMFVEKR